MSFDPDKFIDREFEQELFEELLQFNTEARILSIRDSGGMGKSHLLEKFQYRCRTVRPRIPICLVALDQLPDYSPLSLLKKVVEQLSPFGVSFENFDRYESARIDADFKTIRASVYLQGSTFSGARDVRISAAMANVERADTVNVTSTSAALSPEQERAAQNVVIRSFFEDLHSHCAATPAVVIFDAYEKCPAELRQWIINVFLERSFFAAPAAGCRLALVVAGRETPDFRTHWSKEDCEKVVRSVNGLGRWTKAHVEECLRVHGFRYEQKDLDAFYRLIEMGIPPSNIVGIIQTAVAARGGR